VSIDSLCAILLDIFQCELFGLCIIWNVGYLAVLTIWNVYYLECVN
jgi:hypothetical protein